jgi:hypothetical protein
MAARCTNDGNVQVLWQQDVTAAPDRSKSNISSFKIPSVVLTETIVHGGDNNNNNNNVKMKILQKSGHRTHIDSPYFMGGILFDVHGSMLQLGGEHGLGM